MGRNYILYNPFAGNKTGEESALKIRDFYKDEDCEVISVKSLKDYNDFIGGLNTEDKIVICGGGGTLNYFVNKVDVSKVKNDIYYVSTGTGDDFAFELGQKGTGIPFRINNYLVDLPKIIVKEKEYKFLNGVGYGIDGYCCEQGDKIKAKSSKKVNYALIAVKGLLYDYHPCGATINVDGKEIRYEKVWFATTMNGKYYGGGMKCAPNQDRLSLDKTVSLVVLHSSGKIKTLGAFSSIFSGEHIKKTDMVTVYEGHHIKVKFDKPQALQIDGETISNVVEYEVIK